MSGADLFADDFPHGTRAGWDRGCRGSACPAQLEHGLSCRRAFELAAGDYRYGRLVREGKTPGEIAVELGERDRPAVNAVLSAVTTADETLASRIANPAVWAAADDLVEAELFTNHTTDLEEVSPPQEDTMPTPATVAKATKKNIASAKPSQAEVRAWAQQNGVDVNQRGSIRADVMAAYLAAQNSAAPAEEAAPTTQPAVEQETAMPVDSSPVEQSATPAEQVVKSETARTIGEWIDIRNSLAHTVRDNTFGLSLDEAKKVAEALLLDGWRKAEAA